MYEGQAESKQLVGTPSNPTITGRLRDEKQRLENRLKQVSEALTALEANPEVAVTMDAIAKLGHIM